MQQCKECLKTEYLKRSLKTENDIIHPSVHHKQKKHEGETRPEFKPELRFLRAGGAESNQVVRSGTSEDACRVTSVAVSARTSVLEHRRVPTRTTSLRRRVSTGAAELRRIKRSARAHARRDDSNDVLIHDPKIARANLVDVGEAACVVAISGSSQGFDPHLDVETVDEANAVKIHL